jgi:hypothetical protein
MSDAPSFRRKLRHLKARRQPQARFLSATWRRPTSQANWKKAAGIGIGFNIAVQE